MPIKTILACLFLLITCFANTAQAQGGYAGLDVVSLDLEPDHSLDDARLDAVQFKFGTWFNVANNFGAEFRAALGTGSDKMDIYPSRVFFRKKVEVDRFYGAYLRAQFPEDLPMRPYGLFGITRVETTETNIGIKALNTKNEDYSGVSLGLGVEATLTEKVGLGLEYLRAIDHGGDQISNLTLGVIGRF